MTTLLAIDPGAKTGWALYQKFTEGWTLTGCGVTDPSGGIPIQPRDIVVIEEPQIYPNSPARPADILKLQRIVGRYEERFSGAKYVHFVHPHAWKGSVPKEIMLSRIEVNTPLRDRPAMANYKGGYRHNMIDAIGLGRWALTQPFTQRAA
jgi:hypothetical protein